MDDNEFKEEKAVFAGDAAIDVDVDDASDEALVNEVERNFSDEIGLIGKMKAYNR